ncbi:MAG: DUF4249 family protein, partial [Bacteroidales bacterium]|nr:DUF4249 family protein [Bacteroidales bacterium]
NLRWQLDQTYKYSADFLIFYYYDGVLHEFPDPDSLQICWSASPVYSIFTATTAGTLSQQVTDFPLHYVSFASRLLSIRYSLLIKQMNLSKSAYEYWKAVNEQNTSGDQLFTKLPYQIQGNMHNTSDGNEPVLGFFQVCGIDIKRVYFNRPLPPHEMYYAICQLTQPDYEEYGWMFKSNDWREWPRYVTVDGNGARAVPNVMCIDCRESGGTIVKPEFWTD